MSFLNNDIFPGGPTPRGEFFQAATQAPLTVTELANRLKRVVEPPFADIFVEGEVSNLTLRTSGHCYFQLKDAQSSIACVIFCERGPGPSIAPPRDGEKIEMRGSLSVYAPKGSVQIRVRSISRAGLGALFAAFQRLKEKLAGEGLFDAGRKRPVPAHPRVLGIVTSKDGAALRDILKVIERRAPHLEIHIAHTRVQGDGAAREIAAAIACLNRHKQVDVIIVGRGGGSIEDLWAFNEEIVVRAVVESTIPVISAVGHETDTTLSDFAADLRAPTPSAAAEMVCGDSVILRRHIEQIANRVIRAMETKLVPMQEIYQLRRRLHTSILPRIQSLRAVLKQWDRSYAVQQPLMRTLQFRQRLDDLTEQSLDNLNARCQLLQQNLKRNSAQLRALNPHAVLKRGYSITFDAETRRAIRSSNQTLPGQPLRIVLGEGQIDAVVAAGRALPLHRGARRPRKTAHPAEWFGAAEPDATSDKA